MVWSLDSMDGDYGLVRDRVIDYDVVCPQALLYT